ncbi:thiamine phosphate synthase [Hyphomicrobium sp. D-2]|uniref:thiamine phosphate synthase n=1 Tax=Hyphomicrobium sp. D-2 TaxID=3041621 RepID=UPI002453B094|nr:thiamine phosphate synthase [Hyphomicrobium sp. D-2]MDH4982576.1 thiamine phosphate synthase [Hyphomicrobium sp. D-2]
MTDPKNAPSISQPDVFYPIVPDAAWAARVISLGVRTLQLRIKDAASADVLQQIEATLAIARRYGCQLIVNDYWREAIAAGADYVHLGQEDLTAADVAAIKAAGIRIGISTHSIEELDIALAAGPDYIALGPIYETKLKAMKWQPQGLDRIGVWKQRIGALPLVAIGGITPERADGVVAAGADSVAVITDFMTAQHPEKRIETWLAWATRQRLA